MTRSVKPPRPPQFSGKPADLIVWLDAYEVYAEACNLDPAEWARQALPFMPADTREYLQFDSKHGSRKLPSYHTFKELMISQLLGIDPETLYMRLLDEMVQGPEEPLFTFGMRFRKMLKMINMNKELVQPETAVTKFISALRDPLTQALLTRERLADRQFDKRNGTAPKRNYLDEYIRIGRNCESSVSHLLPTQFRPKAPAPIMAVLPAADEPAAPKYWPAPPQAVAPAQAAPFDMAELMKNLAPLVAAQVSQATRATQAATAAPAPAPAQAPRTQPPPRQPQPVQPTQAYVQPTQPTSAYVPPPQPSQAYVPQTQPTSAYRPATQPSQAYTPMPQPVQTYAPPPQQYRPQNPLQVQQYVPPAPLAGGKDWAKVVCFNCNNRGHGAQRCPEMRNEELIEQRKARFENRLIRPAAYVPQPAPMPPRAPPPILAPPAAFRAPAPDAFTSAEN